MFDSYCIPMNSLDTPYRDPVERLRDFIRAVEKYNNLPHGLLLKTEGGQLLRGFNDISLSQLRTAIVYQAYFKAGIQDKCITKALEVDKSTTSYHKRTGKNLVDTDNEEFKRYLSMVQGIAV